MASLVTGVSHIDVNALQALTHVGKTDKSTFYRAKWENKEVCIKTLIPKKIRKGDAEYFLYEIRIMAIFRQCAGFVQLYGTTELKGKVAIVMEDVEMVLTDFLSDDSYDIKWPKKYDLAMQLAQAVYYMHQSGVHHGDLKSPNILLTDFHQIKLCDYGFSYLLSEPGGHLIRGEQIGITCGSPLWMAPEQFEFKNYTGACEIYSLGKVLWEIATRKLPHADAKNVEDIKYKLLILKENEPLPEDCPFGYAKPVKRALDLDPSKRGSVAEIVQDLSQAIALMNSAIEDEKINIPTI